MSTDEKVTEKKKGKFKKIILVIVVAALVIFVAIFFVARIVTRNAYPRVDRPEFSYQWFYDHYEDELPRRQVTIQSGENKLAGFIYGEENDKALVVFSHGSGAYHEYYMKEIVWFVQHGYRVFAADYTGSGSSEGEQTGGLCKTPIDLDVILTYIEQDESLNKLPKVLIGHSWGAYGVTAVLNYDHDIKAVVSLAAYNEPAKQLADILGRTVETVDSPQNVGSVGACAVTAVGLGLIPDLSCVKDFIPASAVYRPDKARHEAYKPYYKTFKRLYAANKPLFKALAH